MVKMKKAIPGAMQYSPQVTSAQVASAQNKARHTLTNTTPGARRTDAGHCPLLP